VKSASAATASAANPTEIAIGNNVAKP